ncbi:flavin reductase family protein [Mariniluteicoccus flavus]
MRPEPTIPGPAGREPRDDLVAAGAEDLRAAMANFATGVTVVTCRVGDELFAMTANSFTSISLDPPLVMVSISQRGRFLESIRAAGTWAVSLLAAGQAPVARHFADSRRDRHTQFDGVRVEMSAHTGSPLLHGALAWLECRTERTITAGDHELFLGAVIASRHSDAAAAEPLTYFRGRFAGE